MVARSNSPNHATAPWTQSEGVASVTSRGPDANATPIGESAAAPQLIAARLARWPPADWPHVGGGWFLRKWGAHAVERNGNSMPDGRVLRAISPNPPMRSSRYFWRQKRTPSAPSTGPDGAHRL